MSDEKKQDVQKKKLCPDCEAEFDKEELESSGGYCPKCDYPIAYHLARERYELRQQRLREAAEKDKDESKKSKGRKSLLGGIV